MTRRSLFKAAAAAFAGSLLAKLPLAGALPAVPGDFPPVRRFYTGIKGRIEEGPDGQWHVFPDLTMNSDDRSPIIFSKIKIDRVEASHFGPIEIDLGPAK